MQSVTALWLYVQWVLEAHGWKLLGFAVLFHVGRQRYRELAVHWSHQQALAAANDPLRVAVLQQESARVRHKQQERHTKTTQLNVKKAT